MSKKDRLAFIDAVLCLQSKPSIAAPGLVPGARSRFDDFQAVHINQTFLIHFNVRCPKVLFQFLYFGPSDSNRQNFSLGTAISCGFMKRLLERNAATKDTTRENPFALSFFAFLSP